MSNNKYIQKIAALSEAHKELRDTGVIGAVGLTGGMATAHLASKIPALSKSPTKMGLVLGAAGLAGDYAAVKINKALNRHTKTASDMTNKYLDKIAELREDLAGPSKRNGSIAKGLALGVAGYAIGSRLGAATGGSIGKGLGRIAGGVKAGLKSKHPNVGMEELNAAGKVTKKHIHPLFKKDVLEGASKGRRTGEFAGGFAGAIGGAVGGAELGYKAGRGTKNKK